MHHNNGSFLVKNYDRTLQDRHGFKTFDDYK